MQFKAKIEERETLPGEIAFSQNPKMIVFCFNEGETEKLSFEKSVSLEVAERLIDLIEQYYIDSTKKVEGAARRHQNAKGG